MGLLEEIYNTENLLTMGLHEINEKGALDKETLEMMGELLDASKDMYEIKMRAENGDNQPARRINDEMIAMLEEKMKHASTDREREMYRRKIIEVENM